MTATRASRQSLYMFFACCLSPGSVTFLTFPHTTPPPPPFPMHRSGPINILFRVRSLDPSRLSLHHKKGWRFHPLRPPPLFGLPRTDSCGCWSTHPHHKQRMSLL